jgi:putative solute:sodium symporter small subunit
LRHRRQAEPVGRAANPARSDRASDASPSGQGEQMIERKERKPYWRHTKWQMLTSVLPFLVALLVLPLYADQLNSRRFLGFPLGYFLACHGLVLIAVVTTFAYINRQDAIDHWHGAHEDL